MHKLKKWLFLWDVYESVEKTVIFISDTCRS